jgi:phosphatidylglycerol lysyltransferase
MSTLLTFINARASGTILVQYHLDMNRPSQTDRKHSFRQNMGTPAVAAIVAVHGIYIIAATLRSVIASHFNTHLTSLTVDVPLLIGLSLIYLSIYLRRRKRTAWFVTIIAYTFYLGINIQDLIDQAMRHPIRSDIVLRAIILPLIILGLLLSLRAKFVVQSDTQGFRLAARFSLLILLIAFIYGVSGFMLLDKSDFHQEIAFGSAVHHTLDQFDLTTNHPLHAYTKRAHLFVDSLSFISIGAVVYAVFSLFQPLRARFSDQSGDRLHLTKLLHERNSTSEDFFKIWPHDKHYFFESSGTSGLAMHVYRGVALCLGDPAGKSSTFESLLNEFHDDCFSNDWLPAHIHIGEKHRSLYEKHGYSLQKIGQEPILDIDHFQANVASNKYFRHINNKFTKQDYTSELLKPPHHQAIIERLHEISDNWLDQPGRVERGFVMGYFSSEYMQQCEIMVIRDAAGTIQAFLNKVPAKFNHHEATYDLMRHTNNSLSNINDYLLMQFIAYLQQQKYAKLNLGLCPLAGLNDIDEQEKSFLDSVLRFAYANGDRIYSFSGLYRFKTKYEPDWSDRYVAYQGGVRGFSRTMTGLTRAMRVKIKN